MITSRRPRDFKNIVRNIVRKKGKTGLFDQAFPFTRNKPVPSNKFSLSKKSERDQFGRNSGFIRWCQWVYLQSENSFKELAQSVVSKKGLSQFSYISSQSVQSYVTLLYHLGYRRSLRTSENQLLIFKKPYHSSQAGADYQAPIPGQNLTSLTIYQSILHVVNFYGYDSSKSM